MRQGSGTLSSCTETGGRVKGPTPCTWDENPSQSRNLAAPICNPNVWEAEVEGSLVQIHHKLCSESEVSLDYRYCFQNKREVGMVMYAFLSTLEAETGRSL